MRQNKDFIFDLITQTAVNTYKLLNGKVNTIDPYTKLNIDVINEFDPNGSGVAYTTPYGYINISIPSIYKFLMDIDLDDRLDDIRNLAAEIIIHELTHVDQLIDHNVITYNNTYRIDIEEQCINKSLRYMVDNADYLQAMLGFPIIKSMHLNRIKDTDGHPFLAKIPEFIASFKLELIIGTQFKELARDNMNIISYSPNFNTVLEVEVMKDKEYINSQELNDLLEDIRVGRIKNETGKVSYYYNPVDTLNIQYTRS